MKRLIMIFVSLLGGVCSWAAEDNNIKMVTYFPVPYMSYDNLHVSGTCDVGFRGNCALQAKNAILVDQLNVTSGKLNLTSSIASWTLQAGTVTLGTVSSTASNGRVDFKGGLTISTVNDPLKSLQAQNATLDNLSLGDLTFPACDDGQDGHQISWQTLTIGAQQGVFLVCGPEGASGNNPDPSSCEEDCSDFPTGMSCETDGLPGTVTAVTLNQETCECDEVCTPDSDKPYLWCHRLATLTSASEYSTVSDLNALYAACRAGNTSEKWGRDGYYGQDFHVEVPGYSGPIQPEISQDVYQQIGEHFVALFECSAVPCDQIQQDGAYGDPCNCSNFIL